MSTYLLPEQKALLFKLVRHDQQARAAGDDRYLIAVMMNAGRDQIIGGPEDIEADFSDVEVLLDRGFLLATRRDRSSVAFTVTPEAHQLYESETAESSIERLAAEVVTYVRDDLPPRFQAAARMINEAGGLVWSAQSQPDITAVGHKVREAMQLFSDQLYERACPQAPKLPKNQTRNKIAAIAGAVAPLLGQTDRKLLDCAVAFWDAADALAQKVEHGSALGAPPLRPADGKRLVLMAHFTLAELARLAG